jgi:hypothetical protein
VVITVPPPPELAGLAGAEVGVLAFVLLELLPHAAASNAAASGTPSLAATRSRAGIELLIFIALRLKRHDVCRRPLPAVAC